jgi:hypothetical protein
MEILINYCLGHHFNQLIAEHFNNLKLSELLELVLEKKLLREKILEGYLEKEVKEFKKRLNLTQIQKVKELGVKYRVSEENCFIGLYLVYLEWLKNKTNMDKEGLIMLNFTGNIEDLDGIGLEDKEKENIYNLLCAFSDKVEKIEKKKEISILEGIIIEI